ncbi:uncharacterized [Tachysurus ichikawai]
MIRALECGFVSVFVLEMFQSPAGGCGFEAGPQTTPGHTTPLNCCFKTTSELYSSNLTHKRRLHFTFTSEKWNERKNSENKLALRGKSQNI